MAAEDGALGRVGKVTAVDRVDWDAVYRVELPRIYNYFRYLCADRALAEDLTSTTFEKAWRARDRYRKDLSAFSTWLLTIARNAATDHFRRERGALGHGRDLPLDTAGDWPGADSPEAAVTRRADLERLAALLSQLPDRDRELVALKYGAELNNREIARVLEMSESNVGTTLSRVVARLRTRMEARDG